MHPSCASLCDCFVILCQNILRCKNFDYMRFQLPLIKKKQPLSWLLFGGDGGNRNRVQNQFTEGSTSVGCLLSYPLTHRRQSAYALRYSLIPDESRDILSFMFATESTPCPKPWHSSAERKLLITQQELLIYYCQLIFKLLLFKRCNSATRWSRLTNPVEILSSPYIKPHYGSLVQEMAVSRFIISTNIARMW